MALYKLSQQDRLLFEQRAQWSCLSEDQQDGSFRLFNKNANRTQHVKIVGQIPNAMYWVVETEAVDPYFKHVLLPYEALDGL